MNRFLKSRIVKLYSKIFYYFIAKYFFTYLLFFHYCYTLKNIVTTVFVEVVQYVVEDDVCGRLMGSSPAAVRVLICPFWWSLVICFPYEF